MTSTTQSSNTILNADNGGGGGTINKAYDGSIVSLPDSVYNIVDTRNANSNSKNSQINDQIISLEFKEIAEEEPKSREVWSNDVEFIMSCIALSVGLGNVWRFPFTALENGGGAFVIPYLIVLFLVGRPVYYMEMLLGQFSSRNYIKIYDFAPIMRGIGYGQAFATAIVATYYASLMAITLHYLIDSFFTILPWSYCHTEYGSNCVDSQSNVTLTSNASTSTFISSAEYYYTHTILHEKQSIDDGLGVPNWKLAIGLFVSWVCIALISVKGIQSSGKAAYFLALFPYSIMIILLIRSLTLPGAFNGVLYFLKPQWDKILDPKVWYAAITQVFFSLVVCFGGIIMYSSHNRFRQNIHRDVIIVTTLDTFTSLLSGVIIFGILGNLAYETNTTDIQNVIKSGNGLAFISYPDAITKFKFMPQLFAVLFFVMMFVLGIGCNVGMSSAIIIIFTDQFRKVKHWIFVVLVATVGFSVGLIYLTPGGQHILNFLDFYGVTFVALVLAIFETGSIGWLYGVKRFCWDIKFMLNREVSRYYRICWGLITPGIMIIILLYTIFTYQPLTYKNYTFQEGMYVFGWCLSAFGIGQLIIWGLYEISKQSGSTWSERIGNGFKPSSTWGPADAKLNKEYQDFIQVQIRNDDNKHKNSNIWQRFWYNIFD